MSVFGGDSWGREAQHRKRKVDDLLLSSPSVASPSSSSPPSFKKLSSGKFVCLVCPHNPVLDSPLMLSVHNKGSRHVAAETKLKEKELCREQELNKRAALSSESKIPSKNTRPSSQDKPLVERTRTAILELQASKFSSNAKVVALNDSNSSVSIHERRKRELKFIEAGWKRDCHGKWYRDENVLDGLTSPLPSFNASLAELISEGTLLSTMHALSRELHPPLSLSPQRKQWQKRQQWQGPKFESDI